jgi:hypothetical protein
MQNLKHQPEQLGQARATICSVPCAASKNATGIDSHNHPISRIPNPNGSRLKKRRVCYCSPRKKKLSFCPCCAEGPILPRLCAVGVQIRADPRKSAVSSCIWFSADQCHHCLSAVRFCFSPSLRASVAGFSQTKTAAQFRAAVSRRRSALRAPWRKLFTARSRFP